MQVQIAATQTHTLTHSQTTPLSDLGTGTVVMFFFFILQLFQMLGGLTCRLVSYKLIAKSGQELAHMPQPALLYCVPRVVKN